MSKNQLIEIAKEELSKDELDPFRNARLRITSEANSQFRILVEKLLSDVNLDDLSEEDAIQQIIRLDATIKNDLMAAQEAIEKLEGRPLQGSVQEMREHLNNTFGTDDWNKVHERVFSNILLDSEKKVKSSIDSTIEREMAALQNEATKKKRKKPEKVYNEKELENRLSELNQLIGLSKVKTMIRQHLDLLHFNKLRENSGLSTSSVSLHMAFLGNPGTGKTTVAKLVAQIYKEMGLLSQGQIVSVVFFARPKYRILQNGHAGCCSYKM